MKSKIKRRDFLASASKVASIAALNGLPRSRIFAAPQDYSGRFFVTVQADGGWDVASFCDPKINTGGQGLINNWAQTAEAQAIGNLRYAPVAENATFFAAHWQNMLVINGVDTGTNSHATGTMRNWSGYNSAGHPSLTALFAAAQAPDLPLSYLSFGGYAETARLIRYSRINDAQALLNVLTPNILPWDRNKTHVPADMLEIVKERQQERLERLSSNAANIPRTQYAMESYYSARQSAAGLDRFASLIPEADQLQKKPFSQQAQLAILAFKSGVACSADLTLGGFDTHTHHDRDHFARLAELTAGLNYLWSYAEEQGLANRVTVLIASDFARTPWYNNSGGKDHWPVGSAIVMEHRPIWGNRLIQGTDALQNALKIDPITLKTSAYGQILNPSHIHQALRKYLGIFESPVAAAFPLGTAENFDFFS